MVIEQVTALLEQKFQEEEYSDCFIVEIKLHAHNKLDVFVDSDSGMTFEKCRRLSRYLEKYLDEKKWIGEKYILEVSSPGTDRPLQFKRQYQKNIGRKLEVQLHEGDTKNGLLIAVGEEQITLEDKVRIKEGNRKKTVVVQENIPFELIKKATVQISF